jgi:hypothetical protein
MVVVEFGKVQADMLRRTLELLAKKEKTPVFGGIQRPMSMNDRRLARPPGNPMRKYPFHGSHRWDINRKFMCVDFRNPDPNTSLAQFILTYSPSTETSEVADLVCKTLQQLLPGCRVAREPLAERTNFRLTRLNDSRIILEACGSDASEALISIPSVENLRTKESLKNLVAAARFW